MKVSLNELPLLKQELKQYENTKTIYIGSILDNYVFNNKEEHTNSLVEVKQFDMQTWKKVIDKLNWNY
jgi:hypothetical protein